MKLILKLSLTQHEFANSVPVQAEVPAESGRNSITGTVTLYSCKLPDRHATLFSCHRKFPRQKNLFAGEWLDARTDYRKRLDRERGQPQQMALFAAREVVQIGVQVRPWLNELPDYPLELEREDPRTPEEIERDLLLEAQKQTVPMFDSEPVPETLPSEPSPRQLPPIQPIRGFRARARAASVPVRRRRTELKPDTGNDKLNSRDHALVQQRTTDAV
jgi:hypothetical protein